MQIQLLVDALQAFPQFLPYITIYNEKKPMLARTYDAFSKYLLDQFTNMPKEASTRGGHAYNSKKKKTKARKENANGNGMMTSHTKDTTRRNEDAPSALHPPLLRRYLQHCSPKAFAKGYGVDKVDTRSLKSHRSSAHNQIHWWFDARCFHIFV